MLRSGLIFACVAGVANAAKCQTVGPSDAKEGGGQKEQCARNVIWAMQTGITTQPKLYENFTDLTNESGFDNFQCMLWSKNQRPNETEGHGCEPPCNGGTITFKGDIICKDQRAKNPAATTETTKSGGGLPWWAWLLIVIGALLVLGGLAYAFWPGKKPEKKKKKRAVKAPAEAPAPTPTPVATTSVAMPVYAYQPTTTVQQLPPTTVQAAPVYAPAASVSYAAPAVTYAAPSVTYAAPAATYASSVNYTAPAATAVTAFDMIDSNHDGVISRQELGDAMR